MTRQEREEELMQQDMEYLIRRFRDRSSKLPKREMERLKEVSEKQSFLEFPTFYRLARKVRDKVEVQENEILQKGLLEIQEKEERDRIEIQESQLGEDSLQAFLRETREKNEQILSGRRTEHEYDQRTLRQDHEKLVEMLWENAERELQLLEEQIVVTNLQTETLDTTTLETQPSLALATKALENAPTNHG